MNTLSVALAMYSKQITTDQQQCNYEVAVVIHFANKADQHSGTIQEQNSLYADLHMRLEYAGRQTNIHIPRQIYRRQAGRQAGMQTHRQ